MGKAKRRQAKARRRDAADRAFVRLVGPVAILHEARAAVGVLPKIKAPPSRQIDEECLVLTIPPPGRAQAIRCRQDEPDRHPREEPCTSAGHAVHAVGQWGERSLKQIVNRKSQIVNAFFLFPSASDSVACAHTNHAHSLSVLFRTVEPQRRPGSLWAARASDAALR